jgi:hypothetical protein
MPFRKYLVHRRGHLIVGIVAFALGVSGAAYAQGSERAATDGLEIIAAVAGAVSLVIGTGIWIAAAHFRLRAWLALVCTVVAYFLMGRMRQAAPGWMFLVWAVTTWFIAAGVIKIRARRKRRHEATMFPTARVVRRGERPARA